MMNTLEQFETGPVEIPLATIWMLNELAEFRGRQELHTRQSPQKLRRLREHALVESAVCSNRIEGVKVDGARVGTVVFGKGPLQDRDEEEVRGYQRALSWIHEKYEGMTCDTDTMCRLHGMCCPSVWDSGQLKEKDGEIIEKHADGRVSIRFKPVSAKATPQAMCELFERYARLIRDKKIPPLVLWAALDLDFLCVHPFRDGNGRVSRLFLLLSLYQCGYYAGRYISLERLIEESKERYYETLKSCSVQWHEGRHDPWPFINYLLYTLKALYVEFEERVGRITIGRGEKTEMIRREIVRFERAFSVRELEQRCTGVSLDMIRKVLKDMQHAGDVQCSGRGRNAVWSIIG